MKILYVNKCLLCKGIFALLLSCAVAGAMAEDYSRLLIHLTDGSKVSLLLPSQKPEVFCKNGTMCVDYVQDGKDARLSFERDEVESLTFDTGDVVAIAAPTADGEPRIHFDLSRTAVVRVSGMETGDRLQVFAADGRLIVEGGATTDGNATIDLSRQPRGVYMVSVNQRFTFKLMKP